MKKLWTFFIFCAFLINFNIDALMATNCPDAIVIPSSPTFPFISSLTCGSTNDITSSNATSCGSSYYFGGNEALYVWTPTLSYINVTFAYSGQTWTGLMLYQGCPTSGGTCIANITNSSSSKTLTYVGTNQTSGTTISLTAGTTYYLLIDTYPSPTSPCPGTLTINGTALTQCSGTPNSGTITAPSSICSNTNFNLSLSGQTTDQGISYQWQKANSATGPWSDFGTNNPTQTTSQTVNTWYQCIVTCSNSGLSSTTQPVNISMINFPFVEGFENTSFPPLCWSVSQVSGTGNWARSTAGSNPTCSPKSGLGMLYFNSYSFSAGTKSALISPPLDFTSNGFATSFWMYRDDGYTGSTSGYDLDSVNVYFNTTPNLSGATRIGTVYRNITKNPVESSNGWYKYNFPHPSGSIGTGYIIIEGVSMYGNNIFIDDIEVYLQTNMSYISSTSSHTTTSSVVVGSTNNIILSSVIKTSGTLNPISVSSFTFNTNGSTNASNDITKAKLWASGINSVPNNNVVLLDSIINPNGSFIFNLTTPYILAQGDNYFWLTYDISPSATNYNVIDAEFSSVVVGGNSFTPLTSAPAGNRTIRSPLSGVYTINNSLPPSSTNYNNFVDATNDLNILGIAGPVTFNVSADQTFPVTVGTSPSNYGIAIATSGTSVWPIKFQKSGLGANPQLLITGSSATNDIGVLIYGADYVKFDGIDVYDGGSTTSDYLEYGYYLQGPVNNGCQYDTIMNCVVNLNKANTSSRGIYTNINSPTSAAGANSYNAFLNNTIQNAYNGYYLYGNSTYRDKFNKIIGGTIDNLGNNVSTSLYGIYSYYQDTAVIKNITMSNLSTAAGIIYATYLYYNYGLEFSNNILTNFTNTTSATYGIYPYYGSDYKIFNNTLSNFASTTGTMYTVYPYYVTNFELYNNTIRDLSSTGSAAYYLIYPYYCYSGTYNIYNNTLRDIASAGSVYGIYPNYANGTPYTMNIFKNKIYNLRTTSTSSNVVYGIYPALSTTNSNTLNIYNNLVYGLRAETSTSATAVSGIYLSTGTNINVYNNTVYLDYISGNASNASSALYSSTSPTNIDLRNNIFINKTDVTTGTRATAFQRSSTGFTNIAATTNNNLYYAGAVPSSKNLIFFDGTNRDSTLAQYKTRIASKDQTSKTEDVPFISNVAPYNFNVNVTIPTQAESGGVTVGLVVDDINSTPRFPNTGYPNNMSYPATAPDLGCYEFAGVPKDLTPPAISYTDLTNSTLLTGRVFSNVSITDQGSVNVTTFKPRAYYKKSNHANTFVDNTNSTDGWKYVEATGTTSPFTFNLDYSKLYSAPVAGDTLQYFVIAQDNELVPNVGALAASFTNAPANVNLNASNFPVTNAKWFRFASAINGTILVGQGQPFNCLTGAGDTALFKFINGNVVTGNVEVLFTSNTTETGAVALNQFAEEGAGNYTITFKPQNDTPDTIRGTFSGGLIRLNGADRVIFDGRYNGSGNYLTFTNSSTSGSVFLISSLGTGLGATDNIIRNCNIYMGGNGSGTYGISIGGASNGATGAHNNNNSILYNNIYRTYIGIWAQGIATTGVMSNLTIEGNNIGNDVNSISLGHDGIMIANTTGTLVKGNKIYNCVNTNTTSRGLTLSTNTVNTDVIGNYIDNFKYTGTSGYGSHGIYVNTGTNTSNINIINNVVNRMGGDGWSTYTGSSQAGILIDGTTTGGLNLYYNTVSLIGEFTRSGTATITAALAITATSSANLNVKNNIFSNTQRNTANINARNYAIHCYSPISAFTSLDNNLYNVHDTSIQSRLGNISNTQYATLLDWQNATQLDLNSMQNDPLFNDSTDLYLQPASPAIGGAVPITGITNDINNVTRSTYAPTIGAYEFVPTNKTLNLTVFLEGLFNGVNMNPVQDDMGDHFGPNIADQITVELRNGLNPSIVEGTFTGQMLSTNGTCSVTIPSSFGDSYYIVIKHRNSINTWSANPLSFTGNTINYNFTNDITAAYGDNLKEVATGVYAIYVGDVNQDGLVDGSDMSDTENDNNNFSSGYVITDVNGDGLVDGSDMSLVESANNNFVTEIAP
jgi:hypothetical protein